MSKVQHRRGRLRAFDGVELPRHGRSNHDNIVERPVDLILIEAERFPNEPLEAVANHSAATGSTDRHSQRWVPTRIRSNENSQHPIAPAMALIDDHLELTIACQPFPLGQRQLAH